MGWSFVAGAATLEPRVATNLRRRSGWTVLDLVAHFVRVAETVSFAATQAIDETAVVSVRSTSARIATWHPAIADETREHDSEITGALG